MTDHAHGSSHPVHPAGGAAGPVDVNGSRHSRHAAAGTAGGVPSDSAGQPWAGRSFGDAPASSDDGSAPPDLIAVVAEFRAGRATEADVVDTLRHCRLLIPLVARLGATGEGVGGLVADKSAELSIVTVAGPDGRYVMPVYSSVAAMSAWNSAARPVPADAVRVGLAAASEQTDLVVLDPTTATEFVLRRPAVWALAQQLPWAPSHLDRELTAEFIRLSNAEADVTHVMLAAGDPLSVLAGPELVVTLSVRAGLDAGTLAALLARLQDSWGQSELVATRVDSLAVRVVPT